MNYVFSQPGFGGDMDMGGGFDMGDMDMGFWERKRMKSKNNFFCVLKLWKRLSFVTLAGCKEKSYNDLPPPWYWGNKMWFDDNIHWNTAIYTQNLALG